MLLFSRFHQETMIFSLDFTYVGNSGKAELKKMPRAILLGWPVLIGDVVP